MKKLFLLVILTCFSFLLKGQTFQDSLLISQKTKIIGFSPSKKSQNINGVLIKYFDEIDTEISPKKVNGIGFGINPLGAFFPILVLVSIPEIDKWSFDEIGSTAIPEKMNKINGLQLSIVNMEPTVTNGLEVNVSSNLGAPSVINGLAISPFFNLHHTQKGVAIATFANLGAKCRGLQIGLINNCSDMKGLQIGFWNKNGKRSFPIINF